jgi:putative ABC transport system permease protein
MAVVLVTGVLFGLLPARQLVRPDLTKTLREGGRDGGQRAGGSRARRVLVIAEVALSVMLLAGAGLLIRSFDRLMRVDPGFRSERSVSFALSLPEAKYETPEQQAAFMDAVMQRIQDLPGVESAGAGFGMPLTSFGFSFSFEVTGQPPLKPADQPVAEVRLATPDYFKAMAIPIVKGRGFTAADRAGSLRVLLITEAARRSSFRVRTRSEST